MINKEERVSAVDGLRSVAIVAVICYHYLYRSNKPYMPENYLPYEYPPSIFEFGFYGVQLFFVISGFVIFQTLEKTSKFKDFATRRMIRLWPTMALCAVVSFVVFTQFDNSRPLPAIDFVPSLTFITPGFWNALFERHDIGYIDGVYWSLFAEIIFYAVGGLLFFAKPKAFLANWLRLTLIVTIIRIITSPKNQHLFPDSMNTVFDVIYSGYFHLHLEYWVYFSLGIFFYTLYTKSKPAMEAIGILSVLVLLEFYFVGSNPLRVLLASMITIFFVLIYREHWLGFLKFRVLVWVGLISYPLYLLHNNIGLILMKKIHEVTNDFVLPFLPLIVTLIMIGIASLVHVYYEKPVASYLKARFVKKSLPGKV